MRKKIIICALSVFLLILSGVLAFYLHGQNRPIAGLSGDNRTLLRVWMLHSPGGAARWVETQLSAYERQHPGVLIYLRQVSAGRSTERRMPTTARARTSRNSPTAAKPSPSGCAATSGQTADPKKCTHSTPMWCSGPSGATTASMNGTAPSSTNTRNRRKSAADACCSSIPTVRTKMLPTPRRAGQSTSATAKFRRNCPRETAGG